jgi:Flp pilus assembly protein TadD
VIGTLLLLATLGGLTLQLRRADRRLESSQLVWAVRQRGQAVLAGQAPGKVLAGAIPMVLRACELDRGSIEALTAAGDLFLILGRDESAKRFYLEGQELEPRPETYLNLGMIALRQGDREQAEQLFAEAGALDRQLRKPAREALEKDAPLEPVRPGVGRSDAARGEDGADRPH